MDYEPDQQKLWIALSFLFVDTEIDWESIVDVASAYAIDDVEFAVFERVAPVCANNMMMPAPPIWWWFDRDQLVCDIELLIRKRADMGVLRKGVSWVRSRFYRLYFREVWGELESRLSQNRPS